MFVVCFLSLLLMSVWKKSNLKLVWLLSYLGSTILENILEFGEKETARENYLKKPKKTKTIGIHFFVQNLHMWLQYIEMLSIPLITNHFFHSLRSHILMFFKVLLWCCLQQLYRDCNARLKKTGLRDIIVCVWTMNEYMYYIAK